jgi:hypothetical protein
VLVAALSGALLGGLTGAPSFSGIGGLADGLEPAALIGPLAGAVTGAVAAAVAVMLHRLMAVLPRAGRTPGWLALAIAPLASSGMVGYVLLRLLAG